MHNAKYGILSTISSAFSSFNGKELPFGNIMSFAEGYTNSSTGVLYFQKSMLDISSKDVGINPACTLFITAESIGPGYCSMVCTFTLENVFFNFLLQKGWDAQDPRCTRLSISGTLTAVTDETELKLAKQNLYRLHPSMKRLSHFGICFFFIG